jgi:hypothetical protein
VATGAGFSRLHVHSRKHFLCFFFHSGCFSNQALGIFPCVWLEPACWPQVIDHPMRRQQVLPTVQPMASASAIRPSLNAFSALRLVAGSTMPALASSCCMRLRASAPDSISFTMRLSSSSLTLLLCCGSDNDLVGLNFLQHAFVVQGLQYNSTIGQQVAMQHISQVRTLLTGC